MGRVIPTLIAYLFTSVLLFSSIVLLDHTLGAEQLRAFLTYVFVATLAAGLEPGTAKSALLGSEKKLQTNLSTALLTASILKACLASPLLAGIWLLSEGETANTNVIILVPFISALGFVATDVRVLLDAKGRYASAIWLKQGSLSLAIVCAAVALMFGQSLANGILIASVARFFWTLGFIQVTREGQWKHGRLAEHLLINRWIHFVLASVLGSFAASIDRIIAFRFLDAASANAYVLAYELLSKFWLLPYLLAPVTFVKAINSSSGTAFVKQSHMLIAAAGIPFVLVAVAVPGIPIQTLETADFDTWGIVVFACAILIAAFNQILSSELQASGLVASATASATTGLLVAAIAFPLLVWLMGINGLFLAWIVKSIAETLVLVGAKFRNH